MTKSKKLYYNKRVVEIYDPTKHEGKVTVLTGRKLKKFLSENDYTTDETSLSIIRKKSKKGKTEIVGVYSQSFLKVFILKSKDKTDYAVKCDLYEKPLVGIISKGGDKKLPYNIFPTEFLLDQGIVTTGMFKKGFFKINTRSETYESILKKIAEEKLKDKKLKKNLSNKFGSIGCSSSVIYGS